MRNVARDRSPLASSIRLPLAIKSTASGLKLVDRSGLVLAWFYTDEDARRRASGAMLEPDDAKFVAKICARALTAALQQEVG